jgi:hypothetical protein
MNVTYWGMHYYLIALVYRVKSFLRLITPPALKSLGPVSLSPESNILPGLRPARDRPRFWPRMGHDLPLLLLYIYVQVFHALYFLA